MERVTESLHAFLYLGGKSINQSFSDTIWRRSEFKTKTTMRKLLSKLTVLAMSILGLCFVSCGDDEVPNPPTNNEAKVYFVYTLDTSTGDMMTRGVKTNAEVFDDLYEKIKTGDLVAPSFELTLTEISSGVVYTFKGRWNSHDMLTLRTGTYKVVGKSTADGDNIQEKCSFTFDELIDISITSNVITLHAKYDCSLLIFNNENIQTLQNFNGSALASFFTFSTYKYAFVNNTLYDETKKDDAYILGKYTDNAEFKIFTGNLNFEKGKYYVYNSISNGFDVPPMEAGSEPNREIPGFGRVADAVDLGLSVKWASWNVGASKIADYGGLYGAGDPTGLKTSTNNNDYHWVEGENICGTQYDLAHVKWGGTWRLPTVEELQELKDNCSWTFDVTIDGIIGCIATGPNGNILFFPYANPEGGYVYNHTVTCLWSGEASSSHRYLDMDINLDSESHDVSVGSFRFDGAPIFFHESIRPVCE